MNWVFWGRRVVRSRDAAAILNGQRGASDLNLVLLALGVAIVVSVVVQFNSCVKRQNRLKHGWVEVDGNYPHKKYQQERPPSVDDYLPDE